MALQGAACANAGVERQHKHGRVYQVVSILALSLISACSPISEYMRADAFPLAPYLPKAVIDEEASELRIEASFRANEVEGLGRDLRKDIAKGLQPYLSISGKGVPARYRLKIDQVTDNPVYFFFPCLFVLTYLGCPMQAETVTAHLDLQVGQQRYFARATETVWIGLYYNMPVPQQPDYAVAIARATTSALRIIREQARAASLTTGKAP